MSDRFKSYEEIQELSNDLIDIPISEFVCFELNGKNKRNKGYLGNSIQEKIFKIKANNKKEADFKSLGLDLELKVIPFKKVKYSKAIEEIKSKERLSLSMINYNDLINQKFEESHVYIKHQHVQFIAYLDSPEGKIIGAFQTHWNQFPIAIRTTIHEDYLKIQNKVIKGEAHLLSESDTTILSAARKGAGKNRDNRKQPNSDIPAKSRVFSIKPRYVQTLFYSMMKDNNKFSWVEMNAQKTEKEYIRLVLDFLNQKCVGLNVYKYSRKFLHYEKPEKIKSVGINVISNLLKKVDSKIIKNLELYGYKIRTITVNENNKIQESVPLPHAINPEEMLIWETDFEGSDVYHQLMDYKFIFIPIKKIKNELFLQKPFIFYFDENDLLSIDNLKQVWENTRHLYKNPKYKKIRTNSNGINYHLVDFIKQSDRKSFHIRPKAKNSTQLHKIGNDIMIVPQAFWINKEIIQKAYENSRGTRLR